MPSPLRLLISSGNGPTECRIAVRHVIEEISKEAKNSGLDLDLTIVSEPDTHGPVSAVISLHGINRQDFSKRWVGTIQWICESPVRPKHRRRNWFVGVFKLDHQQAISDVLETSEIRFDTFRAGGPGGQHQNTTDSAVRATHIKSGVAVVVRDQRSQHRNKQVAIERLAEQIALHQTLKNAKAQRKENLLHHQLERGNPIRSFKGVKFKEI
ncbi:peptide chain release factor H [Kiloniella antarctica]|uniref:Peptide chain release factor H n=1 Tax=Kiloniella antarctica TaxID=1550907 RepID=A0ABW5BL24_9PROT